MKTGCRKHGFCGIPLIFAWQKRRTVLKWNSQSETRCKGNRQMNPERYCGKAVSDTEGYRSGHNEAVLKTVWVQAHKGSNPFPSANKNRTFVYQDEGSIFNDVCLWQMMLATPMMTASPNDAWLCHILWQTSHHCEWNEQHHFERSEKHHIAIGDASFTFKRFYDIIVKKEVHYERK